MYELLRVETTNDGPWHVIRKTGTEKLYDTNLYTPKEADEVLDRLDYEQKLKDNWPDQSDPRVQALIEDPEFDPIEINEVEEIDQVRLQVLIEQGEIRLIEDNGEDIVHPDDLDKVPTFITQEFPGRSPLERVLHACEVVAAETAGVELR